MIKLYYEGKSFYLRGAEKEDFTEHLYNWANDNEVCKFMLTGINPSNKEKMEEEYEQLIKGDNVVFAIVDKHSKRTIGLAGLYGIRWQPRIAEFRIIIGDRSFWNKGIGTETARLIIKHAFDNLNLNKVFLGVNSDNTGALKSYEKAGFVKEGVLRQEVYRNGRYYDATRFSILREEFYRKK